MDVPPALIATVSATLVSKDDGDEALFKDELTSNKRLMRDESGRMLGI